MSPVASPRAAAGEVAPLLRSLRDLEAMEERLDRASAALLGRPYLERPLGGGPGERERLVTRLDGFDCVTYVETAWALALATSTPGFRRCLRRLRYREGRLSWWSRNHYLSQALDAQLAARLARRVLPALWRREPRPRTLAALAGYPPLERRLAWLPLEERDGLAAEAHTGDVVGFVSERPDLDVFHTGLLAAGPRLRLRHAAKSAGRVVEEDLERFLARNRTPGLLVVRPLGPRARPPRRRGA